VGLFRAERPLLHRRRLPGLIGSIARMSPIEAGMAILIWIAMIHRRPGLTATAEESHPRRSSSASSRPRRVGMARIDSDAATQSAA